jgi:antitoxin component YwqK of YwqJK toxin-antitoxin module
MDTDQQRADRPRVNDEDLDIDWAYQQATWEGEPFTGVAFELHPNGMLVGETDYENGFKRATREWYGPGRPREEWHFGPYGLDGEGREWYPDGRLKTEGRWEYGIVLTRRTWDEQGNLTEDYSLAESDPEYATLEERRRLHSGKAT